MHSDVQQATQTEANTYQPPLPLTVVGQGFGYISNLPQLQYYTQPANTQYIDVQEVAYPGPPNGTVIWDTANITGNCQVYIADWTDNAISLLLGVPEGIKNSNGNPLYPLTDMSPQTFFQQAPASACPITAGYYLNVTVTNPQSATPGTPAATQILSTGTPY